MDLATQGRSGVVKLADSCTCPGTGSVCLYTWLTQQEAGVRRKSKTDMAVTCSPLEKPITVHLSNTYVYI